MQTLREKLRNRLTPLHLYKMTPGTNCGKCGYQSCLAFSAHAISGQSNLDGCPYLDDSKLAEFRGRLQEQQSLGIGVSRESFEKTLSFLEEELRQVSLTTRAESLGAAYASESGIPSLGMRYFGEEIVVTTTTVIGRTGREIGPYEKILIYNYILGGAAQPSGDWVGMETLPNSVSKIKSLRNHCEAKLADAFSGRREGFLAGMSHWGALLDLPDSGVDLAVEVRILPNLSIRVLFWDQDREEDYAARVKFLFDSRVLQVIDLESLLFAAEQLTERLIQG